MNTNELEQQGTALVAAARALTITDDASYAEAGERRRLVKAFIARVDEVVGPSVEAAHKAHRAALALLASMKKPAQDADDIYKRARLAYEEQQARARREAEAERARIEAAERERIEQETRRLQAEAASRRATEIAAAAADFDTEKAARLAVAPIVVAPPAVQPLAVPMPTAAPPPPKTEGIVARMEWDFEIVDAALVPREYLVVDEKLVRAVVRTKKGATTISGVRVFQRRNESVR